MGNTFMYHLTHHTGTAILFCVAKIASFLTPIGFVIPIVGAVYFLKKSKTLYSKSLSMGLFVFSVFCSFANVINYATMGDEARVMMFIITTFLLWGLYLIIIDYSALNKWGSWGVVVFMVLWSLIIFTADYDDGLVGVNQ